MPKKPTHRVSMSDGGFLKAAVDGNFKKIKSCLEQPKVAPIVLGDKILKAHEYDVNCRWRDGSTALMLSIGHEHPEIAEYLISKSADVNLQDNYGLTALIYAVVADDIKTAKLLLKNGAQTDLYSEKNDTALSIAKKQKQTPFITILENHDRQKRAQFKASPLKLKRRSR